MSELQLENIPESELENISGGAYTGPCFKYQIRPGDCLSVIALTYGTTVKTLCEINKIPNPDFIRAWDYLLIPYTRK